MLHLRMAKREDTETILAIYRRYIESSVTFEYVCPTKDEFAQRITTVMQRYPWVVCEENGTVVGYAYASRQRERAAYGWNADLSIYLNPESCGCGIGGRLYGVLLELLKLQNVVNVYGVVTSPNPRSQRFHLAQGFTLLGTYRHTGYKCGRWYDVQHYEKQIGSLEGEPKPFIPVTELDRGIVEAVCSKFDSMQKSL